jgi:hypothetical protein
LRNAIVSTTNNFLRNPKPGGTWKDWDKALLPDCYKKESGQSYATVYGRMSWDKVSPTITTQFSSYGIPPRLIIHLLLDCFQLFITKFIFRHFQPPLNDL